MAKPAKKNNTKTTSKKTNEVLSLSLFDCSDNFLQKYAWRIFWFIFGITLICGALLYDPRISPSGDDSGYIMRAYDFYKNFTFPSYQGPLYPMILSLITAIFGISLFPLKLISMLSILAFMYITFIAFRNRIPYLLLFSILLLTSTNSHILFYASQTYSEAFYMFMQSFVILIFALYFIDERKETYGLKFNLKRHVLLALVLMGAVLTRTVGFALVIGIIGYFLFYKQWKNIALCLIVFAAFYTGFECLKYLIWGNELQFGTQSSQLFSKNFYAPQQGKEDLAGLLSRFIKNSDLYLSKHFYIIMGLRERVGVENLSVKPYPILTILTYIIAFCGLILSYRKNKYIFFGGLIAGTFLLVTFISLQTIWDQERLIIPTIPLMLLLVLAAMYYALNLKQTKYLQFFFMIVVALLTFISIADTSKQIKEMRKLKDEFSGLTPDWYNYLKASQWAGQHLPKDALVACRKADMSSIYANGKKFYGITVVPSGSVDWFVQDLKTNSDNYILIPVQALNDKPISMDFYSSLQQHQRALLYVDKQVYYVAENFDLFAPLALASGIEKLNDIEGLEADIKQKQTSIFYPDSLLIRLKDNSITHILTASLRQNPYVKTGNIINTVERYLSIIQNKYPRIFLLKNNFGAKENEPAQIYEVDWNQFRDK
ncbi:MAG: hypothetical protein LBL90_05670 [Prevotellaceae bacterium]|jgi:hypothetical protein|nr:hypothetical protein [Prevotellaceae bacterium]